MKLRLRCVDTNETLKLSFPDDCSLDQLRDEVSKTITTPSSSSLKFSLNRKDEIQSSSPHQTLKSLGITSGDLIFFTLNPNCFNSETPIPQIDEPKQTLISQELGETDMEVDNDHDDGNLVEVGLGNSFSEQTLIPQIDTEQTPISEELGENDMEDLVEVGLGKSFSVPSFLRKVFRKELGHSDGRDHKLLVISVHAVLVESGFVGFDSVSKMIFDGFNVPDLWPSSAFTISLTYTLPGILAREMDFSAINGVVLKFHTLGKFLNIYGCLANKKKTGVYRVCIDEERLVPFLNVVWANCDEMNGTDMASGLVPEKEVFEFWKTVKDKLALPLLIDLCDQAGLPLPPCFMRLPTDLKSLIFESLSGADLAKVGCVCSELRYLSSDEDLWRRKYVEKFGDMRAEGGMTWKEKYAIMKRRKAMSRNVLRSLPHFAMRRNRNNPLIVHGIHDREAHHILHALGGGLPFLVGHPQLPVVQARLAYSAIRGRQNFRTHCDLARRPTNE